MLAICISLTGCLIWEDTKVTQALQGYCYIIKSTGQTGNLNQTQALNVYRGMNALPLDDCPEDFRKAYREHQQAWLALSRNMRPEYNQYVQSFISEISAGKLQRKPDQIDPYGIRQTACSMLDIASRYSNYAQGFYHDDTDAALHPSAHSTHTQ